MAHATGLVFFLRNKRRQAQEFFIWGNGACDRARFFQNIDMGGEAANLGIQVVQLTGMGRFQGTDRIASFKDIRQAVKSCGTPFPQNSWCHPIFAGELIHRFRFLQYLQDDLGFEAGSVRRFHTFRARFLVAMTV